MDSPHTSLGTVVVGVVSPTEVLLVRQKGFNPSFLKFPGGRREKIGDKEESIEEAGIREVWQETGVMLPGNSIRWIVHERKVGSLYYPHFCIANVSQALLETHARKTKHGDEVLEVERHLRHHIHGIEDFLPRHKPFRRHVFI